MTLFQPQLIEDAGFSAEEHTVITEDGYLLTIHRFGEIIVKSNELGKLSKSLVLTMIPTQSPFS